MEIIKEQQTEENGDSNQALGHRPGLRIAPVRVKGASRYTKKENNAKHSSSHSN